MKINYISKTLILLLVCFHISGCRYIDPFLYVSDASEYATQGDYEKAIPLFEKAIDGFSRFPAYESFEHDARCGYALALNEYSKAEKPRYLFTARKNFDLVLGYLQKGNGITRCTEGVVISSRANTLQREAAYTESDEKYFELLKNAYFSYQTAIQPLIRDKEWLSLAFTYFNLAETSEMYGDLPEAIKWIEKAIKINEKYGFEENQIEDANYFVQLKARNEQQLKKPKIENASKADKDAQ